MGMNSTPRAQAAHRAHDVGHGQRRVLDAVAAVVLVEEVDLRLLKNGRNGSLFANFRPDAGSHITIDFSPEPCRAWTVATSCVWNAISQNGSKPSTCSIHSSAGFIVWKFEVM